MRIQHNVTAMNSYRNFNTNNSALSKNLEKLSSGYKINRAGDDAAGLAISEKMRAQITGIEGATKNAKDGISLIQTAEGALTEVHSMLNRMTTLAEQSANGTYDNEVDRAQLQKEVASLKEEIDRIADSTNYNGIKLLDGSLSTEGAPASDGTKGIDVKMGVETEVKAITTTGVKGKYYTSVPMVNSTGAAHTLSGLQNGDKFNVTLNYTNADGDKVSKDYTIKVGSSAAGTAAAALYLDDGSENGKLLNATIGTTGSLTSNELDAALKEVFEKDTDVKTAFDVTVAATGTADGRGDGLSFEARVPGTNGAKLESLNIQFMDKDSKNIQAENTWNVAVTTATEAEDPQKVYDLAKQKVFDLQATDAASSTTKDINEAIMEINGEKFVFLQSGGADDLDVQKAMREAGVTHWVEATSAAGTDAAATANTIKAMATEIAAATGLQVVHGSTTVDTTTGEITFASTATGTQIIFRERAAEQRDIKGGLSLQIGDTADEFNKMTVSIADMHIKALGLKDVDISTQEGAAEAMKAIKNAINTVSDTRGGLGALQNRLDHTINNLGVMRENIQNAESMIRDTDVAEEMMTYTKNNILNQSAQSMLAQANQLPQGVLQLLNG